MRIIVPILSILLALAAATYAQSGPQARNGYQIEEIATVPQDLPTSLSLDPQGRIYCLTSAGRIYRFTPPFQNLPLAAELWYDGTATLSPFCTGLTWHAGKAYISHRGTISTIEDTTGDDLGDTKVDIITGLPSGSSAQFTADHQNNQIVFDDANFMYFGVGSQTDNGPETAPFAATVMRANDDGTNLQVFATGLRNVYDMAFDPAIGLVGTENAPNMIVGNPDPVDELNLIASGEDYGFPDYFGTPPAGTGTRGPIFEIPAHAAPTGLTFDTNRQWSGFPGDLYVCLFAPGAGALVRISSDQRDGTQLHDGFLEPIAFGFTAVVDCAFTANAELLCVDFITKKLYRITPRDSSRVRLGGVPRLDSLTAIELEDPAETGDVFLAGLSDLEAPAFPLSNGEVFHMNVNTFAFQFTTEFGNGVLGFSSSFLDPMGQANGWLYVPNIPSLVGQTFYLGYLSATFPALSLGSVSETLPFQILPQE